MPSFIADPIIFNEAATNRSKTRFTKKQISYLKKKNPSQTTWKMTTNSSKKYQNEFDIKKKKQMNRKKKTRRRTSRFTGEKKQQQNELLKHQNQIVPKHQNIIQMGWTWILCEKHQFSSIAGLLQFWKIVDVKILH